MKITIFIAFLINCVIQEYSAKLLVNDAVRFCFIWFFTHTSLRSFRACLVHNCTKSETLRPSAQHLTQIIKIRLQDYESILPREGKVNTTSKEIRDAATVRPTPNTNNQNTPSRL